MAIKPDLECILIYCALLGYLAAAIMFLCKAKRTGWGLYVLGFATALGAFVTRWHDVGHVPLQNLFEVFLCLGILICPLSLFCIRFVRVGAPAADCLIGFAVLFPAGFVFTVQSQELPPALQSWLFAPHVAAYMAAYMILTKATAQALGHLFGKTRPDEERLVSYELGAYKMVRLGFPLLTLGLVLGAVWGKRAWGDYWNWDPKELWSLATWLIYVGYLHFRHIYGRKYPRASSSLVVSGLVAIVITLLWVNLSRIFAGLHSYAA